MVNLNNDMINNVNTNDWFECDNYEIQCITNHIELIYNYYNDNCNKVLHDNNFKEELIRKISRVPGIKEILGNYDLQINPVIKKLNLILFQCNLFDIRRLHERLVDWDSDNTSIESMSTLQIMEIILRAKDTNDIIIRLLITFLRLLESSRPITEPDNSIQYNNIEDLSTLLD
jgi:hypothetical protein